MTIRFGVIRINHGHIYAQVQTLLGAGAECAGFYAPEDDLAARFAARYPQAPRHSSAEALLEDPTIQIITTSAIPNERGPLGVDAMRHGKDFLTDKPGFTTLAHLEAARRAHAETDRFYAVYFGRYDFRALLKAGELARAGAIGQVVHLIGLGPHRASLATRPGWFFVRERYGGIITDLASHQFDIFVELTGSTRGEVAAASVANYAHPQHPELEDMGEVMLRSDKGTALIRVDWLSPDGLGTWGDMREVIVGTEGYMEVRPTIDLDGQPGGDHLLLVDQKGTRRVDCSDVPLDFGRRFLADVVQRTQTAQSQERCFLACELSLRAQAAAVRLGNLR